MFADEVKLLIAPEGIEIENYNKKVTSLEKLLIAPEGIEIFYPKRNFLLA